MFNKKSIAKSKNGIAVNNNSGNISQTTTKNNPSFWEVVAWIIGTVVVIFAAFVPVIFKD